MADRISTLVLFGATGDLSRRMLLPSLYDLDSDGLLPDNLRIVGTARTELDDAGFRGRAEAALQEHLPDGFYASGIAERFLSRLHYVPLDINQPAGFERLAETIGDPCHGVAIFLSTAPSLFKATIDGLAAAGLACPTVRMALEKPLGADLESSREINDAVAADFPEDRTFRIDHYLGKETVQNLIALRFANLMFEPLWNSAHIDHVQITVAETVGLEGRGDYYDGAGALRDMVQNHMLQLLALVAMEPPSDFNATAVRDEKVKVLRALRPITAADAEATTVTGQYARGAIDGEPVPGYGDEIGGDSGTETFVALKAHIDNWRWKGVPFYLRTGKRMPMRDTEIFIQFKDVPYSIFASRGATTRPNKLIIGLQPEESIELRLMSKTPGLDRQGVRLREIPLDIGLANAFSEYRRRIAYERLLLDLIEGDPTLFVRRDEVEAQWGWIDRIRTAWAEKGITPRPYAAGTWGPSAAIALTERDGISWHSEENMALNPIVAAVTDRIVERSKPTRRRYLELMAEQKERGISRPRLSCGNFAHGFAAAGEDKAAISHFAGPNIGIVTAYNDMLSAHQPYGRYPEQMKIFAREVGATAQVAGGVPAMCDGVTQGQPGMDLSLFSRDVIAMGTAIALSHGMFDAAALLGICDKIVPGLLIGALRFGHLPMLLVPGGPMPSGLPNKEKQRVRQLYAEGKAGKDELLKAESASYHAPGTCTFYGTANSNQMMMELMGLHIPNAAFINPGTPLRQAVTRAAVHRLVSLAKSGERPLGQVVDEKAIVNAMVGLLATGGSTNHFIHLPAIARAAGIVIDWQDFAELSSAVPLVTRIYPNGSKDVNDFQDAGGMAFVTYTLSGEGLIHTDHLTAGADSMDAWVGNPELHGDELIWKSAEESADVDMLRPANDPFLKHGGLSLVQGNLGRAVFKTSAVDEQRWMIEAPARCFADQNEVLEAFKAGELDRDCAVVVRFQGPRANGMPELHKLTPTLGVLQDRGHKVALITDGRMSGASGKVPAAIHVSPEALPDGPLARVRDGDVIRLDARAGTLEAVGVDLGSRPPANSPPPPAGTGRELFAMMRLHVNEAEAGASAMLAAMEAEQA